MTDEPREVVIPSADEPMVVDPDGHVRPLEDGEEVQPEPQPYFTVNVSGSSDDLIEVDGALNAEFLIYDTAGTYLGFSDGSLLWVRYDEAGVWRLKLVRQGPGTAWEFVECPGGFDGEGREQYTERMTLTSARRFAWVLVGKDRA